MKICTLLLGTLLLLVQQTPTGHSPWEMAVIGRHAAIPLGQISGQDSHEMRRRAWAVFAGIIQPSNVVPDTPEWATWPSRCTSDDLSVPSRKRKIELSTPLELLGKVSSSKEFSSLQTINEKAVAFDKIPEARIGEQIYYNVDCCKHIVGQGLLDPKKLDQQLADVRRLPAPQRTIAPFGEGATVVKAFWLPVGPGLKARIDTLRTVPDLVVVYAPDKTCNLPIGAGGTVNSSCFYSVPNPNDQTESLILVGLHVAVKGATEWSWATFWWHPNPDSGPYAEDKNGITIPGVWGNYLMNTTVSADTPAEPTATMGEIKDGVSRHEICGQDITKASRANICFNPFLEGGMPNGTRSNCVNCHAHAAYPLMRPDPRSDPRRGSLDPNSACFKNRLQLDHMWSLVPLAGGNGRNTDTLQTLRIHLDDAILRLHEANKQSLK